MTEPTRTPADPVSARRKLLRGSFALPTVLAVHNGSALATSSTKLRCALNQTDPALLAPLFPAEAIAADNSPRVTVYHDAVDGKRYVKVTDLSGIAGLPIPALGFVAPAGTSGWVQYVSGGAYTQVTPAGTPQSTSALAAVLFDGDGVSLRVVGFVQPAQATAASRVSGLTASCWSSVRAH